MDRPSSGELEQRSAPDGELSVEGNRLCGLIPYGVESRDLGNWREVIEPGALASADRSDLVATLNHDVSRLLGRYPTTLTLEDRDDGLAWSCELPSGPTGQDVRVAVERGDLNATSWRMVVGRDRWEGDVRHVQEIRSLRDVAVVTSPAYPAEATRAELRERPDNDNPNPPERQEEPMEDQTPQLAGKDDEARGGGGLQVEERAESADDQAPIEERIADAMRSVNKGESRDLTTAAASAGPITPPELSTHLFDRLRPASIALSSGIVVVPTDRQKVTWPQLVSDVDPSWIAELESIPTGEPGFGSLEAEPKKLAHLISPISNEVIDDSEPDAVNVLNGHLATMLALKLDHGIFEGNATANPKSINGLKFTAGIQTISMGTDGAALSDYDPIIEAVGKLRDANVPGPYAVACHGSVLTELELLKESVDSSVQLPAPANLPPFYVSSQLSTDETKGTSSNARSIYVYAPGQVVLVRRRDATIELDRSRLFNSDASEMRGTARADLLVPNPVAVCRIDGVVPAA